MSYSGAYYNVLLIIPCSNSHFLQFFSSVSSFDPQSLTKSQILLAGTHVLFLHLMAQGLGVAVGVGDAHRPGVTKMSSKAMSPW